MCNPEDDLANRKETSRYAEQTNRTVTTILLDFKVFPHDMQSYNVSSIQDPIP